MDSFAWIYCRNKCLYPIVLGTRTCAKFMAKVQDLSVMVIWIAQFSYGNLQMCRVYRVEGCDKLTACTDMFVSKTGSTLAGGIDVYLQKWEAVGRQFIQSRPSINIYLSRRDSRNWQKKLTTLCCVMIYRWTYFAWLA